MAVTVRLSKGGPLEFRDATSAESEGPVFHVQRWDPEFRRHEDVEGGVLDSSTVIQPEVSEGGEVVRVVVGRGRGPASS
jgi:hypothetical protein